MMHTQIEVSLKTLKLPQSSSCNMRFELCTGDQVEVIKHDRSDSDAKSYYHATLLGPPAMQKNLVLVKYKTLTILESDGSKPKTEYVELNQIRPLQPVELNRWFKVGDEVDALRQTEGCWIQGVVKGIVDTARFLVGLYDDLVKVEVYGWDLRLHREWNGDIESWTPPPLEINDTIFGRPPTFSEDPGTISRNNLEPQMLMFVDNISNSNSKDKSTDIYRRPRKMRKIECSKSLAHFDVGTKVEVSSEEEGYKGSYFAAVVVGFKQYDKFVVEYLTLTTDDETGPLTEETEGKYIRPYPPQLPSIVKFQVFQKVDVWQNEGWWVGVVSRVLNHKRYIVYFDSTNEELEYAHSDLRTHQDWIHGKWVKSPKEKVKTQLLRPNMLAPKNDERAGRSSIQFAKGMHVEVRSDEEGYEGAWFAATIVNLIGHGKYLVEYQTLKTDDGSDFLKEEAHVSDIRPCPPPIRRVCRYDLLGFVDVWYNDGWWVGQVYKLHAGSRYGVYFKSTNEILVFEHWDLRPHQEWRNGVWASSADRGYKLGGAGSMN